MSAYENYEQTSRKYDAARFAMAAPAVERVLTRVSEVLDKPLSELVVLEAGCGTGNYSVACVGMGVGTVHALDHSAGMLEKLQAKVDESEGSALQAALKVGAPVDLAAENLRLPFEDGTVHVALVPQVTHHLVRSELEDPFSRVKSLIRELGRVLAPGGALVVQTQTPEQHRRGFWWADIIPVAVDKLARRFCDVKTWQKWLSDRGFDEDVQHEIPAHPLVNPKLYLDVSGPFRAEFRGWDSTWSLATPEELDIGLKWFKQMVDSGRADGYVTEREEIRAKVGQTTTILAFKPLLKE